MPRALRETLRKQREEELKKIRDNEDEARSRSTVDLFSAESITPLMRAATREDPSELLDLLNSERDGTGTTISSSLFVKDSVGRTALDWARIVNNEMNVTALRKAMLSAINDARVELVANDLDTSERVRMSNKEAGRALMEAVKQRRSLDAIQIINDNRELDRELVEEYNDRLNADYDALVAEYEDFKAKKMDLHVQKGGFKEDRLDYGPAPIAPKIDPYFVNVEDHSGFSALMIASSWDMIDVVSALIDLHAKVEHTNKYGHTALTWSCTVGHSEIVKKLLFHGANIHHRTLEGRTGMHYACLYLKAHVVSTLLDYLFERFSNYRVQHAKAAFDETRWTRYASMLEKFIDTKDINGKRCWELLPIPPPGHKVFDGKAALRREEEAKRQRKRERRMTKMAASGIPIPAGGMGSGYALDEDDGSDSDGSYDSLDDETPPDTVRKVAGGEGGDDSDEEDRREQQALKDGDPQHQEILQELARVKAVVEGSEAARPVVTPSNADVHKPTPQQLEMLQAAEKKKLDSADAGAGAGGDVVGDERQEMSSEVVVPLHLREGPAYGAGGVLQSESLQPMSQVPGIDGYDDPGNLFVRTATGTPKYAGKEGIPATPLAPTVKMVESGEVRPTSRHNILDAQQEHLQTELYSTARLDKGRKEKEQRERQQREKHETRLSAVYRGSAENRKAFIKGGRATKLVKRKEGPRVKTPQQIFLEEKKLRVEAAGGEEFVYSTDFRTPPPSAGKLPAGSAPGSAQARAIDSPERQSSLEPRAGSSGAHIGRAQSPGGEEGDRSLLNPVSFFSAEGEEGADSFANVLDLAEDAGSVEGAEDAGMQSRPMTATEAAEHLAKIDYENNEAAIRVAQREDEKFRGASVPGGSNGDSSGLINALGTMHNYYTGTEMPAQSLNSSGVQDPAAGAFADAAAGGVGGGAGGGGGYPTGADGAPVPLVADDTSLTTVDTDEAHATGLHGLANPNEKLGGDSNMHSHVVEVHQIGQLFMHARERIEEWRVSADKEAALMEKVECWLGCGATETVEGVAAHVRDLCPYRAKECVQCRGIYRFCDLADHMTKDCLKRKVACSNAYAGCNEILCFDFVYRHEQLRCKWRKVPCRLNCGGQVPLCKRDEHEEYHCNLRELTCDQCKQRVHAVKFGIHLRDECPERMVKCRVSCQQEFRAKDLERHEREDCVQPCKWGCGLVIGPSTRRDLHQAIQCLKRPVECDNGCGMKGLTAEYLEEHKRYQCPYESLRCPNDCGARLNRISMPLHLDSWHGNCPSRLVRCPSNLVGWKVLVVKDEPEVIPLLNTHSAFEKSTAEAAVITTTEVETLHEEDDEGGTTREVRSDEERNGADRSLLKRGREEEVDEDGYSDVPLCVPVGRWKEPSDENEEEQKEEKGESERGLVEEKEETNLPKKVAIGTKTTVVANKARAVVQKVEVDELSGGDVGIILRYHRAQLGAPKPPVRPETSNSSMESVEEEKQQALVKRDSSGDDGNTEVDEVFDDITNLTGVDRVFVKFKDRHEWLDYWSTTRRIIPLKRVKGEAETHRMSSFRCGWIRYSAFDDHLNYDCINRQVWLPGVQDGSLIGGDGFATVADEDGDTHVDRFKTESGESDSVAISKVYRGQATTFENSVDAAKVRNKIDEFIVKPSDTVRCDYCANQFGFGAIERHQKYECGKVVVRCKLGCGMRIQRESVEEHAQEECVKRPLTCPQCGEEGLWVDEIQNHLDNLCPERPSECALGCGIRNLRARDEERHRLYQCLNRLVTCTCGKVMKMDELEDHQVVDCVNKPTLCPQGCGQTVPRDQVDFHIENLCEKKVVFFSKKIFCPIGCGLRLMRRDVLEHVSYYCKRRLSDCPFGCGQSVQFDKLRLHLYFCPKRPITCEPGAKECTKLFFKWFYCEDSAGDPGGVGFDGDIPGDGPNQSDALQEMAELFHTSPRSRSPSPPARDADSASGSLTIGYGEGMATSEDGGSGAFVIANNGKGLNSNWVANDNTKGVDPRIPPPATSQSHRRPQSVQIMEEKDRDGDGDDDDESALTIYDPRIATKTPTTAGGGYITPSGRYRHDGDGAGRKTPLPKGASIYFDDHKMFFHAGLRMRSCKRHTTTALMSAVKQSEYPLCEFIIDSCEGMDMEMESNTGETALTIACRQGKLKYVELLIQGGADINHETSTGKTALIEAVRASQENIPMIEFLVKSGALVAYKTQKHNRTAIDWSRLLVLPSTLRILELGKVVQQQTDQLFSAIGSGDMDEVERLIGDGEFFEPNNEARLFDKMEAEVEITRKAHADVTDLKNNLNGMTDEVEESRVTLHECKKELDEAAEACEETFRRQEALQMKLSKLFVSYERIAHTLLKSDLEEISRMRRPPLAVRAAVFAFGIMLGELDYVNEYPHNDVLDMHSAHRWWPKLAFMLSKSGDTIRKIRSFSLAKLLSDLQAPFLRRARSLYQVVRAAILEDEGVTPTSASITTSVTLATDSVSTTPVRDTLPPRSGLMQSSSPGQSVDTPSSPSSKSKRRRIKKSTDLPDFMVQQKEAERAQKRKQATAAAIEASRKTGRPDAPPPRRLTRLASSEAGGTDDEDDDEEDDEGAEDTGGGADSTVPVALTSWHARGARSTLVTQKEAGKLGLPSDLGIKEPWYLESQKRAQQAAEMAATQAAAAAEEEKKHGDAVEGEGPEAGTRRRHFIPDVEWDSEADEAGGGEWGVDGEWKPVVKKRSQWWHPVEGGKEGEGEEGETERKDAESVDNEEASEMGKAILTLADMPIPLRTPQGLASRPATSESARSNTAPDVGLDDAAYTATLKNNASSHFVRTILILLKAADQLAIERSNIKAMKEEVVHAGQVKEEAKQAHQAAYIRHSGAVSKRLTTEKILTDMMKYARHTLRRAKDYREKLRVFRLLDKVTLSGHTAVSWAASLGNMEALEMLLSHGATVGYTTQLMHLSATYIQQSYRLYRFITEARRAQKDDEEKAKKKKAMAKMAANAWKPAGADDDDESDDDVPQGNANAAAKDDSKSANSGVTDMAVANTGDFAAMNNSYVIEQMFKLKRARGHVLHKIRYFRQKMRFPVPEAAYRGNWQIIHRIYERRLFHYNFSHTWIFPAPPPPFLRIMKRFVAKPRKLDMHEIMTQGMNDLAAGMYVEGEGWVGPNDPRDHFGECQEKLTEMWKDILRKRAAVHAERLKLRRLTNERVKQEAAVPLMLEAIRNREYRRCVYFSTECGVSIDMETPEGSTVLVGASEEDTGVPFYAPMLNDDGRPCLAVEYLLDRTDYRPSVNLEMLDSGHNAIIRACSLGRASVVEALCDRGAEVNYVNKFGKSPLHYAAQVGSFLVCRILLERGADVHKQTPEGETAYSIAETYGFLPIMTQMGRHAAGFMGPVRPHRGRVDEYVRCPRGCGASFIKEETALHEVDCPNRVVKCPLECGERLLMSKELDHHMSEECVRRIVPCQHCDEEHEERLQPKHYETTCRYRYVPCVLGCGKDIQVIEMKKHFKFCTWREITCTQGCGAKLRIKDMLDHDSKYCEMRKLPCPLNCGAMVTTRLTTHHVHNVCPNRVVSCRWCDRKMEFRYVEAHERSCDVRHEPCPTKCGEMVCIGEPTQEHMRTTCKHRFVPCPEKCGQKVRWADIPGHLKHLCPNRLLPCPLRCVEDETLPILEQQVTKMRAKMIDIHTGFECPNRPVHCILCKRQDVKAKEITRHKEVLCDMREVNCRNPGCAKIISLGKREEHERKTCKFRPLSCPLGCGMDVPWIQHGKHMGKVCSMRRVECPLKCGTAGIRHHQLQDHIENDCPRRHHASEGENREFLGSRGGSRGSSRGGSRPGTRGKSPTVEIGHRVVSPVKTPGN